MRAWHGWLVGAALVLGAGCAHEYEVFRFSDDAGPAASSTASDSGAGGGQGGTAGKTASN